MANKISVLIDVAVDGANRNLKSFKSAIADADTATGKFRAGASSAMDSVKANAGNLALAGGAALVAFGAKAVGAFNDLALEAGRMSEALGMSTEETSRYIEVAGDLGIESSKLETVIGKMNQTAGKTPAAFAAIGAEIKKNADGSTNVNETFLATVDALNRIQDPAKRAAAAQQIFGRSWRDSAELIGQSSDDIRKSLEAVSDQKVIDPKEVERAREYRAAMDSLKDASEDLSLMIGGKLVPALAGAAKGVNEVIEAAKEAPEPLQKAGEGILKFGTGAGLLITGLTKLGEALDDSADATQGATNKFGESSASLIEQSIAAAKAEQATEANTAATALADRAADAYWRVIERVGRALDLTTQKFDAMSGRLSDRSTYLTAEEGLKALATQAVTTGDVTESQVIDMQQRVLDYGATLKDEASKEHIANINTAIDQGDYNLALYALAQLEKTRTVRYNIAMGSASGARLPGSRGVPEFHSGGIAGEGHFRSDEVPAVLQKGEMVLTEGQQASVASALTGGGGNTYVTINTQADPQMVIDAIRKWERRNGGLR